MSVKIAINGFGRIGRNILRSALQEGMGELDLVAINDLTDAATLGHLFKYDSVHGTYDGDVQVDGNALVIDGERFDVLSVRDPAELPWSELGVDIVFEATGPGRNDRAGSERRRLRSRETRHHLERQLHDQLRCTGRKGAGG